MKTMDDELEMTSAEDRAFLVRLRALPETDVPEIPEKLDQAVLTAARKRLTAGRFRVWKIALPLAASLAVCSTFLLMTPKAAPPLRTTLPAQIREITAENSEFEETLFNMSCEVGAGMDSISSTLDLMS